MSNYHQTIMDYHLSSQILLYQGPVLILSVLQNVGMTKNVTRQKTTHFWQKIREKAKIRQYLTENVHIIML